MKHQEIRMKKKWLIEEIEHTESDASDIIRFLDDDSNDRIINLILNATISIVQQQINEIIHEANTQTIRARGLRLALNKIMRSDNNGR